MKNIRKLLMMSAFAAMLLSCSGGFGENDNTDKGQGCLVSFSFDTECFSEPWTKTSGGGVENYIYNVNVYAYREGVLESKVYCEDGRIPRLQLSKGQEYDIYALANVGEVPAEDSEKDMLEKCIRFTSSDEFLEYGLPMCSALTLPVKLSHSIETMKIVLNRLVARVNFSIDDSSLKYGSFEVKSVCLKQASSKATPFIENCKAETSEDVFDIVETDAVPAVFYLLENCQGNLLEGNVDPWNKQYDNPELGNKKDLCSYIEVTGLYRDKSGGLEALHTYRMYLGENETSNFSVERNAEYSITLSLSDMGVFKESWKVGRTCVKDNRSIRFSESNVEIDPMSDAGIEVECYPEGIDYHLEWSTSEFSAAGLSDPEQSGDEIHLSNVSALDEQSCAVLKAVSFDSLVVALCTLTVKPDNRIISGDFYAGWEGNKPQHVAQKGRIRMRNIGDDTFLVMKVDNEGVVRLTEEDSSVVVECLKEGTVNISLKRKSGKGTSPEQFVELTVNPVHLCSSDSRYYLSFDGSEAYGEINRDKWGFSYGTDEGTFDKELYKELLEPQISVARIEGSAGIECLKVNCDSARIESFDRDCQAMAGTTYLVTARPKTDVDIEDESLSVELVISDPFSMTLPTINVENEYYMPERDTAIFVETCPEIILGDYQNITFRTGTGAPVYGRYYGNENRLDLSIPYSGIKKNYGEAFNLRGESNVLYADIVNKYSLQITTVPVLNMDVTIPLALTTVLSKLDGETTYDPNGDWFLLPSFYYPEGESRFYTFDNSSADNKNKFYIERQLLVRKASPVIIDNGGKTVSWTPKLTVSTYPPKQTMIAVYPGNYEALNLSGVLYDDCGYGREFPDWYYSLREGEYFSMNGAWNMVNPYQFPSSLTKPVDCIDVPESFIRIYSRLGTMDTRTF